ncbi:IS4 family transposase [Streptomyces gibsoniae]|uniref:IS4 family transposase n=1 Tax=Streptomyces gibsoniae TaxID=3075529 RepID=A0ABU2UAE7_9ACTN|nr:IS4 family transposase [Streptomyces sp. DSM 41699]MDT0470211.1 IS4 family transposase [Streptomyces sp. DSM 41699]
MGRAEGAVAGRLTDDVSIGLLATVFPEEAVEAAVDEAGAREERTRALPSKLMMYLAMALWLEPGKGYVRTLRGLLEGLRWSRGGWDGYRVPSDGAISLARYRLGEAPLRNLFEEVAAPVADERMPDAFWRGLRLMAVDGTVFDLPSGRHNEAAFGVPAGGSRPQARLVALAECGTLALAGAAFDSIEAGERALFERLLDRLAPGMLLLADRGFPSYDLYTAAAATGAELLWRVSASFALPVKQRLADGTYLSELRGTRRTERVTVRVIEYSVVDDDGVSEVFCLITTLLDPETAPALELARNYAERWSVEILFKLVKIDLRTSGGVLRSGRPEGVRQELWALLCVYQALRTLITRAAVIAGVDPARISFPPVLDAVKSSVRTAFSP